MPIGSFLNPDDRESFATAFGRALATGEGRLIRQESGGASQPDAPIFAVKETLP